MFAHGFDAEIFEEDNDEKDELMSFLSYYVRTMHSDRYFKQVLMMNPGATYLYIITPSDIAYAVVLVKNSRKVWGAKMGWQFQQGEVSVHCRTGYEEDIRYIDKEQGITRDIYSSRILALHGKGHSPRTPRSTLNYVSTGTSR